VAEPSAWALAGQPLRAVGLWPLRASGPWALALLEGEAHLGLGGEGAEGQRGVEAVDGFHRFSLVAGEAGEDGLLLLAKGEGVAEGGEGGVFVFHFVWLVHL